MDWKILLVCFIGSIAATTTSSGWRENTEFNYDVEGCTLSGHPDVGNQYSGIILKYILNIVVRSNGILVATLRDPKYAKVHTHLSENPCTHIPHEKLKFNKLHMVSSHFEVEMKNGIVKRIRMQKHVPNWEINMIKSIMSQFQLDTRGENLIKCTNNVVPEVDSPSGAYKTMEESILGKYEMLYEINQLPEINYQDNDWVVPHPELKGNGQIIEIVKTKNFDNDKKHVGYHHGLGYAFNWKPFSNNMGDFFSRSSVSKVTVSGKLDKYIIQSVETTNNVHVSPAHNGDQKMMVASSYKLSLSSLTINTFPPPPLDNPSKYVDLKSLVYQYNNPLSNIDQQDQQSSDIFNTESFGTSPRDWKRNTRQTLPETDEQNQQESEASDSDSSEEYLRGWKRETTEPLPAPMHPLNVGYMGNSVKLAKGANVPNSVIHIAQDIAHDLKKPGEMPQAQTLSKFLKLNQLMRLLDERELQTVSSKLHCNERDSHMCHAWKVYCDGLAESGTPAALMEIQRLIVEKKLNTESAVYLIPQMIKSVRVPNYRYMRMFYAFSTHPEVQSTPELNAAAILSFSRLVGDVFVDKNISRNQFPIYVYGSFDTPEGQKFVTKEFVPYLIKQLDDAIEKKDNPKAQVYIYALGYVGHPKMLHGYKKYLEGNMEVSHFLRSQMVNSLWRMSYLFPEEAQTVLNKLYRNSAEHTDVRVTALQLLSFTTPSASMLQKIAVNINFDLNKQVNAVADSMIRTLAENHENIDLQTNARSAVHLLPKRKYGSQYSSANLASYTPEDKTNFNEFLFLVGSDDSIFKKCLEYGLYSTNSRLGQEIFSVAYMTNSMEAIMKALRNETENSNGEQDGSDPDKDSKWSSEQVRRMLKIKPNHLESPEGNMYFGMNGLEGYLFSDVNNLNRINKAIQEIKESLKKGKDIHITKFIDQQGMAIGCPTETGLPTWYSSDNPLLINIEGRVSGDLQTNENSNHLESVDIDSRIRIVVSKKMQDRVGFVVPFEHHHYMAGHDVNAQVYLPLKIKVKADMNENTFEAKLAPSTNEKRIPVIHFSTVPYTSRSNILKLRPVIGDSETHIINAKPKGQFNTVLGQNAMGMSWNVHIACEHSILRDGKLFNAIGDHRLATSLFMHLFHGYIHNSKLEICYDAENSNQEMNIQAAYEQWKKSNPRNNKSNNDNENESNVARKLFGSQDPKEEVKTQVSEGLSNPTVDLYQLKFSYHSKHDIEYTNIAGIAKSDTKERNKMMVVSTKHDRQQPNKNYRSVLLTRSQTPNVNAIDPLYALKHAPSSNSHLKLVFGKDYDSATKINASIEMSRSHDRNRCLQGSQTAHDCKKESDKGNVLLKACSKLHLDANSLDQVRVQLEHKNLKPEHQNMTNHLVNYVKYLLYENLEENSVNATGSGANNKVNIKINFHEDFARVNITKNTENRDVQFNNVHVPSWLRPVVKVHPTYNALARLQSELFESQWYQASCAVDKSAVNTFDNKDYSVKQGQDWTVMFLYVPNCVNKRINSHKITQDEEDHCSTSNRNNEEFLILTRNLNKEIKITIRTPETQHKLIEIDMIRKDESNVEVHVNQKQQNLHTDSVTEVANGFIKMVLLPNQEVRLDVQHAFTVLYDGARARLTTEHENKFRNKVRGLCGNFDSQPTNDWYAPETCVYNNVEHFVASYQPYRKDPRPDQSKGNKCSYQEVIYGNVIPRNDDDSCTEYRRVYTMVDNTVCITMRPVRVCKLNCIAQDTTQQKVLANCLDNDDVAQRLIKKIEDNQDLDDSSLGNNSLKEITLKLPKYCVQRF